MILGLGLHSYDQSSDVKSFIVRTFNRSVVTNEDVEEGGLLAESERLDVGAGQ